ncbi:hypothetical protein CY35_02G080900 [Sphagnum magellanicum]|nr:hypothetical protein CY35_02G080900 [Sphagnum magellanicum]
MAAASSLTVTRGRGEAHLCKASSEATGIAQMVENYGDWAAAAAAASTTVSSTLEEETEEEAAVETCCSSCCLYETCECCGLREECTPAYVERMRAISCGRFVCGLCVEAVKEEMKRMGEGTAMEDALHAHMNMCVQFKSAPRLDPVVHLASALRQILRRSVQDSRSPKTTKRKPWPRAGLSRSASCVEIRAAPVPSSETSAN